ncbi:MAG: methyltransferase domain-containing protein [Halioglobus sp.]
MVEQKEEISSAKVGRNDLRRMGWFNAADREIVPGITVSPGMRVVDVGCGVGQYSNFCARLGAQVTAVDIQADKLASLSANLPESVTGSITGIVSNCDPIPLPDDCADLIICTEVLEHVPSPEDLCREMLRIVKPGGKLVISVPDDRSEQLIKEVAAPAYFQEPNHIRIFSRESFTRLILESGLEIERTEATGAFWSMFFLFKWATTQPGESLIEDVQPLTQAWAETWHALLKLPNSDSIVRAMNDALPKSQFIIARKNNG